MENLKQTFYKYLLIVFLIISHFTGNSQNIFDLEHTKQYASYLYETEQYELAISEYERLVFLSPTNEQAKLQLIKSYRKNGQLQHGINKIDVFNAEESFLMNNQFSHEYIKLLFLSDQTIKAKSFLNNTNFFTQTEKNEYDLSILLLQSKYIESQKFIIDNSVETDYYFSLAQISNHTKNIRYKSPFLAMSLSVVVPGLGKFYTRDWKDGLMSLFFVGTNVFQAYRGFSKNGIESIYGWVFSGISFGFYTGNILGSFKSAKRYNKRINYAIQQEVQNTVFNNF